MSNMIQQKTKELDTLRIFHNIFPQEWGVYKLNYYSHYSFPFCGYIYIGPDSLSKKEAQNSGLFYRLSLQAFEDQEQEEPVKIKTDAWSAAPAPDMEFEQTVWPIQIRVDDLLPTKEEALSKAKYTDSKLTGEQAVIQLAERRENAAAMRQKWEDMAVQYLGAAQFHMMYNAIDKAWKMVKEDVKEIKKQLSTLLNKLIGI